MFKETIYLQPLGRESTLIEKPFKLSTIDTIPNCAYTNYAIFFRLRDEEKSRAVELLKSGLMHTLAQAQHLCGTIEKDEQGRYSFVQKRESKVQVVIHNMDPNTGIPTLDDIEKGHFGGETLKDINLWSIPTMTWGEGPEANPDSSPAVSAYQINRCTGGLVLVVQVHYYALDAIGFKNYIMQLAANCAALANSTPFPPFDPANLDASRLTIEVPADELIDGPPVPQRNQNHRKQQAVLLHLPKSKAAELKRLATPQGGDWVSTYDASCAYLWRVLSKVRVALYEPSRDTVLWWGEAINLRPRLHGPLLPQGLMRNALGCAISNTSPVTPLTVAEVVDEAPLSKLASYIRALTNGCDNEHINKLLAKVAPVRDKSTLSLRLDSCPPMSMFVTDHRPADVSSFDFGFGKPITYRHLFGGFSTEGAVIMYPPVRSTDPDEGCVFSVTMEKELVGKMIEMREFCDFFEYRGSLLKHMGPRRVANVPTDDVFQLNAIDQVGAISNMMGWTMLKFDQVLDPVKLQETLVSLIKTGDWRKLGGRLRRNEKGHLVIRVPKEFTEQRPAVGFSHAVHYCRVQDHELGRQLPTYEPEEINLAPSPTKFHEFAQPSGVPKCLDDYLRSDLPQLWLHIVSFEDATLTCLTWPHATMDGAGLSELLTAWAYTLAGLSNQVPPCLSLRHDLLNDLISDAPDRVPIKEEIFFDSNKIVQFALMRIMWLVMLIIRALFAEKQELRNIWVPKRVIDKIRQESLSALEAADEQGNAGSGGPVKNGKKRAHDAFIPGDLVPDRESGRPFVSESDAMIAFFTRAAARALPPKSRRTVNISIILNIRDRLPSLTARLPKPGVFISNLTMSVQALLPAQAVIPKDQGDHTARTKFSSLGLTAASVRSSLHAGLTEPQLRALAKVQLKAYASRLVGLPIIGGIDCFQVTFSSLKTSGSVNQKTTAMAPVAAGQGERANASMEPRKGCTPVGILVIPKHSSFMLAKMQLFIFARGENGAWVQGTLHPEHWKIVERELREIDRRG
ncbi:hypothetical protein PoMZ_13648 [Pyricularia oryzae]|uniref:Trichothecene 3-O-acetyltransferase-like N-terminal domain-containing protein n=1 Tax=Pyricularia oryzae TaxID=318829 RepID=A0A4P7NVL2_PYROR|nr:hypothetical protein PoMZ_13648 [Pyricularia oryzae]